MTKCPAWPLHPSPNDFETLQGYVKRLSKLYGVTFDVFCSNALGIHLPDREALSLTDPSDEVLERLSVGVGIPVDDLRVLRPEVTIARLNAELEAFLETEEGKQAYVKMFGELP